MGRSPSGTSEVSERVIISGHVANTNAPDTQCDNGTIASIIINGNEVWSQFIDYNDNVGN